MVSSPRVEPKKEKNSILPSAAAGVAPTGCAAPSSAAPPASSTAAASETNSSSTLSFIRTRVTTRFIQCLLLLVQPLLVGAVYLCLRKPEYRGSVIWALSGGPLGVSISTHLCPKPEKYGPLCLRRR